MSNSTAATAAPSPAAWPATAADATPGGVLVIGGGMAGLILALFLHRSGVRVRVFEAYKELSETAGAALQLGPNAMSVMAALQLDKELEARGVVTAGMRLSTADGSEIGVLDLNCKQRYGHAAVFLRRHQVHTLLADTLESEGCHVQYAHKLTEVAHPADGGSVTAHFANGSVATGDVLIGCDGIHSRTRRMLFPAAPEITYQGYLGVYGLLPLSSLTAEEQAAMRIQVGLMNSQRGPTAMFLAAGTGATGPNGEQQFLLVTKTPMSDELASKASRRELSNEQLLELMRPHYADWNGPCWRLLSTHILAPGVSTPFVHRSIGFDEDISVWHEGRAVLIGDAAHCSVPGGSGAAAAIEDAHLLANLLIDAYQSKGGAAPSGADFTALFKELTAQRLPRARMFNASARDRNPGRSAPMGAVKIWMMKKIFPWIMYFKGPSMFDVESKYKVPGWRIIPPRASAAAAGAVPAADKPVQAS